MSKKYENKSNILKISNKEYLQKKEVLTSFFLNEEYVKMTEKQVANFFNVPKDECYILDKIISELEEEGVIYQDDSKRLVRLSDKGDILKCVYSSKSEKFGFCLAKDGNDVYISNSDSLGAINGDDVLVRITKPSIEGKTREGIVLKILKHNTKFVIGTFVKSKNFGFVVSLNDRKIPDIYIPKKYAESVKDGSIVKVEILKYATSTSKAEGKIISIIGNKDDENIEIKALYKSYGLDTLKNFSKDILDELDSVPDSVLENEKNGRVDRTSQRVYTIDGEDAKDLDDAVRVTKLKNGNYKLDVHIADVSYYVREGSLLDKEAQIRGTSVYMLSRVIPMLPKELSNGICSLNAGEDRFTLSCSMEINNKGEVVSAEVYKGIINVTERMNYHDVQKILDKSDEKVLKKYEKYIGNFELMAELAEILKKKRLEQGYLNLDIPESKIDLDENGKVISIGKYETSFSNEIIEQFMLSANETIAEKFYWLEAPFIYRVHEDPDIEKVKELNKFLYNFGLKIRIVNEKIYPKEVSKILEEIKGKEEEKVVSTLILRTLKIARYEAENKGHFGIASKYYCHFTSPIRRYPDLFIHRIISKYLEENYVVSDKFIEDFKQKAIDRARMSSEREKVATKAERDSEDMKKAEFMQDKIGQEYEGIVSSVTQFGIFVELENTVEGLIRFENLGNEYFIYDENRKRLIGENSNKVYKIGDKVKIRVISANKLLRQIDFEIVEA